ncbi:MAG TPA: hypothetical protein VKZ76_03550 [Edaphocola sp.]|nr:hypothetical protein [Edaphocola sp.]
MKHKLKKAGMLCLALAAGVWMLAAQDAGPNQYMGETFLSDKVTRSGNISVADFLKLMQDTLWVKDKRDGKLIPVGSFVFSYAERNLYEDETGKPFIMTDLMYANCKSSLDSGTFVDMRYRAKPGDTAFIEEVRFLNRAQKDKISVFSSPIKLVLTK